jgi:hypothetical protein
MKIPMDTLIVITDTLRGSLSIMDRRDGGGPFGYTKESRESALNILINQMGSYSFTIDIEEEEND